MLYLRDLEGQAGADSPDALTPHATACERPLLRQQYQSHVRMEGRRASAELRGSQSPS